MRDNDIATTLTISASGETGPSLRGDILPGFENMVKPCTLPPTHHTPNPPKTHTHAHLACESALYACSLYMPACNKFTLLQFIVATIVAFHAQHRFVCCSVIARVSLVCAESLATYDATTRNSKLWHRTGSEGAYTHTRSACCCACATRGSFSLGCVCVCVRVSVCASVSAALRRHRSQRRRCSRQPLQ